MIARRRRQLPDLQRIIASYVLPIFFVIYFTGFAIYDVLLREGFIPPFLGGYIAITGLVLALPCVVIYLFDMTGERGAIHIVEVLFLLFMGIWTGVAAFNYINGQRIDVSEGHLATIPQLIFIFVLFRLMDFESLIARILIWVSFIYVAVVVLTLDLGDLSYEFAASGRVNMFAEDIANYQHYALSVMVFSLALIRKGNPITRYAIYVLCAVVLFKNGARSEMIGLFPTFVLIELAFARKYALLFVMPLLTAAVFFQTALDWVIRVFPDNRIVYLLRDASTDQSVVERLYTQEMAIDTIRRNPLFGDYAYYPPGFYSHNILSVWADFGLPTFILFLSIIFIASLETASLVLKNTQNSYMPYLLGVAVLSVLLFLVAKNYQYPAIAMLAGLTARVSYLTGDTRLRALGKKTSRNTRRAKPPSFAY